MQLFLKLFILFFSSAALAQGTSPESIENIQANLFYWERFSSDNALVDREPSTAPHLKVLAWNVGQSRSNDFLQNELSSNFEALMRARNSPDLLVLVEAHSGTVQALKRAQPDKYGYRYGAAVPYSKEMPWAYFILLWKEKNMRLDSAEQFPLKLLWDSASLSSEEIQYASNVTTFVKKQLPNLEYTSINRFKFRFKGKSFSLYPVHFANVWPSMQQYFYPSARKGAKHWMLPDFIEEKNATTSAKAFVLKELIQGKLNPHAVYVNQYIQKINELHPAHSKDDSVLVVGDFNAFPRVEGIYGSGVRSVFNKDKARACAEFEKHFKAAYAPEKSVSFPTDSYLEAVPGTDYRLLIDLAYYRGSLWRSARATVLPLSGSDHYPVFYEFLYEPSYPN